MIPMRRGRNYLSLVIVIYHFSLKNYQEDNRMRKKFLVFIGCATIFFFCIQPVWADAVKVGVLNMKTLQKNSLAFQKVRDGLKKKFDLCRKNWMRKRPRSRKCRKIFRNRA